MKLKKKYFFVGLSLIILIILNQLIIQYFLYQKKNDANLINVAGRQRMFSQRVNSMTYQVYQFPNKHGKAKLEETIDHWKNSHLAIMYSSKEMDVQQVKNEHILNKVENSFKIILEIETLS
jgi:nitrate/nitrite-specific signal transduction histidine kinase